VIIELAVIRNTILSLLEAKGFNRHDADSIVEVYLGGELRGHKTHGLAPFPGFLRQDFSACKLPEVILDTPAMYFVEANENCGITLGRSAADIAIAKAKTGGCSTAIIRNMFDWVRPGAIAEYIANQDMIGIVTNDGSGRSIAPPGGVDPTLGTNPIAYGLPTEKEPLVVELATAKKAWGNVRVANKFGTDLPEKTFLTKDGNFAKDPKDVHSVLSFGEHKGFSLALLIEIMNGAMVGHNMMADSNASSYSGEWPTNSGTIMVYNPALFTDLDTYKEETTKALDFIKSGSTMPGVEIRIPGENASRKKARALQRGSIDVDNSVWNEILAFKKA